MISCVNFRRNHDDPLKMKMISMQTASHGNTIAQKVQNI